MDCPECGKEMKYKGYSYYGIGSWDMDYPDCYHEEYRCSCCKITFVNGRWNVPKKFIATEKQINAAKIISNVLGVDMPPPTKRKLWEFINQNMEKSKKRQQENKIARENDFSEWCEENSHWLPEYF